jgi:hypothetical protein
MMEMIGNIWGTVATIVMIGAAIEPILNRADNLKRYKEY